MIPTTAFTPVNTPLTFGLQRRLSQKGRVPKM
jgi:hypothetical protein